MTTVVLADDHLLVREGLRHLLERTGDITVTGEADDGQAALRLIRELQPDVAVIDLAMPGLDGIEVTKCIVAEGLKTKVLVLTMHATEEYAVRLLQAGARGFIGKGTSGQEVAEAIRRIAAGKRYLPVELTQKLTVRPDVWNSDASPLQTLSDRELQVLKRLAEGRSSREIAQDLHVSVSTVDTHRARMLAKLGVHSTTDLIRFALHHGVIDGTW
jgi:two-component system, NarL family, invasion response regulator UvrY